MARESHFESEADMRKLLPLIAGTLLLGGAAQAKPVDREAELERALRGRVAGEPVECIDLHHIRSSRVITDTAIIYDAGSIVYVNRPDNGADQLNQWDTMVTRLPSTRLCNIDTVTMVDQASHSMTGIVFLGDFVPYRRVRTGSAD
jgi:DNA-binding transcriptional regulator YdaS (Cro superfamily)